MSRTRRKSAVANDNEPEQSRAKLNWIPYEVTDPNLLTQVLGAQSEKWAAHLIRKARTSRTFKEYGCFYVDGTDFPQWFLLAVDLIANRPGWAVHVAKIERPELSVTVYRLTRLSLRHKGTGVCVDTSVH